MSNEPWQQTQFLRSVHQLQSVGDRFEFYLAERFEYPQLMYEFSPDLQYHRQHYKYLMFATFEKSHDVLLKQNCCSFHVMIRQFLKLFLFFFVLQFSRQVL